MRRVINANGSVESPEASATTAHQPGRITIYKGEDGKNEIISDPNDTRLRHLSGARFEDIPRHVRGWSSQGGHAHARP